MQSERQCVICLYNDIIHRHPPREFNKNVQRLDARVAFAPFSFIHFTNSRCNLFICKISFVVTIKRYFHWAETESENECAAGEMGNGNDEEEKLGLTGFEHSKGMCVVKRKKKQMHHTVSVFKGMQAKCSHSSVLFCGYGPTHLWYSILFSIHTTYEKSTGEPSKMISTMTSEDV